jgi:hypothetical protein
VAEITTDDLPPLPECTCIHVADDFGSVSITNGCGQHNPFTGVLVEQPVQFTGFLSVLQDPKERT